MLRALGRTYGKTCTGFSQRRRQGLSVRGAERLEGCGVVVVVRRRKLESLGLWPSEVGETREPGKGGGGRPFEKWSLTCEGSPLELPIESAQTDELGLIRNCSKKIQAAKQFQLCASLFVKQMPLR